MDAIVIKRTEEIAHVPVMEEGSMGIFDTCFVEIARHVTTHSAGGEYSFMIDTLTITVNVNVDESDPMLVPAVWDEENNLGTDGAEPVGEPTPENWRPEGPVKYTKSGHIDKRTRAGRQ